MSYEKNLFHRLADEAWRIASYEDTSDLDDGDLFTMADAMARIVADRNRNALAVLAGCVFAASLGGMGEVFEELPQAKRDLFEYLMGEEGYEFMESDSFSAYVRKDD